MLFYFIFVVYFESRQNVNATVKSHFNGIVRNNSSNPREYRKMLLFKYQGSELAVDENSYVSLCIYWNVLCPLLLIQVLEYDNPRQITIYIHPSAINLIYTD